MLGKIERAHLGDANPPASFFKELAKADAWAAGGIVVDNSSVYFAVSENSDPESSVLSVPKAGGASPSQVATIPRRVGSIEMDASRFYALTSDPPDQVEILTLDRATHSVETLHTDRVWYGQTNRALAGIAVSGGHLYYRSGRLVRRIPVTGGVAETVAVDAEPVSGIAADASSVFWFTQTSTDVDLKRTTP